MKTYFKYLIIGWSIVSIVLVILSFQVMKKEFIEEKFVLWMPSLKQAEGKYVFGEQLFQITLEELGKKVKARYSEYSDLEDRDVGRRVFDKYLKDKGLDVELRYEPSIFYIVFPIYTFFIWALPVIVFSLVGIIFSRK